MTSTSKQVVQDVDIFEDSAILANFNDSSFRDENARFSESKINDSANRSGLNVSALCCDEEISGYDKLSGQTWIYPTNYPVRDYQFNIIKAAILKNTLVSLPTGLGKTFIAAVIMYNFYRWYPLGKIVFVAPTRPLVAQQIDACYNIVAIPPNDTVEMTGHMQASTRKTHWQTKRVFFATPQVIYNDIKSGICPSERIRCLVIDEAHKARGNYAYCQIVGALTDMGHKTYRVLALSATPGSKVEDVVNVVKNLHIAHLELRTESCIDVSPYSHSRNINTVIVPIGTELTHLRQQYGEIIDDYARRLKQLGILPHNLGNISKGRIVILYKEFQAKDRSARHPQHNHLMRDFTHLIALFHGLELLTKHGSRVFLNFFDEHPEKSWIQSDDRLTVLLERLRDDLGVNPLGLNTSVLPDGTVPQIPDNLCFGHPKFDKLKEIMVDHFKRANDKGQDTRAIVFCEYRESVNLVHCLLLQCRPLITPQTFVGQGASGKDKVVTSQKQQLRVMKNFREGLCNTLVATCVAEEGLDVGSVDLIVCFDISTRSPIRLVQRCGRTGRERGGQVHILVTEGREHQTLVDCMRQRDGLNKKIQNSRDVQAALYASNPRLIPHDFVPKCQKMHITVAKKDTSDNSKKNKDLRTMLLGRGSSSSSSSSNKDLETANVISEQEFKDLYPNGLPYTTPVGQPLELWAKNRETIKELSKSDNATAITNDSTWLEWQRALQSTINVGHSMDSEILASVLQFSDAKRCEQPLNTQKSIPGVLTQDFTTQTFLQSPSKMVSPVKTKQSSPAKKQTKKKQNLVFKSPGKKDGDIRAMFSSCKSTKNYTKLINDLGIQNDGSISTKLINLLVDLSVTSTTRKPCYICENICECAFFIDLRKDRTKPKAIFCIEEMKLPDIDLIDEIDTHAILKCAKNDSLMVDCANDNIGNVPGVENNNNTSHCWAQVSPVQEGLAQSPLRRPSPEEIKNESDNFALEFDFESIDLVSPVSKSSAKEKDHFKDDVNFDIGDIEDVFNTSSPEEVGTKEIGTKVDENKEVDTKEDINPKQALGFFGLDSIEDIFADSDDDVNLDFSKTVKTPVKLQAKSNLNIDHDKNENQMNVDESTNKEIKSILNENYKESDTPIERLSPSLLSGNIKRSTSPVLCSQVRKFKLSTKKKQPDSLTPQNTTTSKRQLMPDFGNNKNLKSNQKTNQPKSSTPQITNTSKRQFMPDFGNNKNLKSNQKTNQPKSSTPQNTNTSKRQIMPDFGNNKNLKSNQKTNQPKSSTPQNTNTSKRQIMPDFGNNKNVKSDQNTNQPKSSLQNNNTRKGQLMPDLANNNTKTDQKDATKCAPERSEIDTTNRSMFTITQLVDMINKTDTNVSKQVTIIDDDERCLSPILLTQSDKNKKKVINNNNLNFNTSYDKCKTNICVEKPHKSNTMKSAEKPNSKNNTSISEEKTNSKSKNVPKQNYSLIILDSEESESDDNTQVYDPNEGLDLSFSHIIGTPNTQESNMIETPKKQDSNIIETPKKQESDLTKTPKKQESNIIETPKKQESSKLTLHKKIDSKPSLKIVDLDDVPNVENSLQSSSGNKRKAEAIDDVITASPFFHKKSKLQLQNADKKTTLQEKVLAALNKKTNKFNNDTNINYVLSPNKVFSQKENVNPFRKEKARNTEYDEEEYIRKRNLEMLQIFRRDSKVLSPKKQFESVLNTSKSITQMSQKRKLAFDDSDDDFDNGQSNYKNTDGHTKPAKNHKVRKKKHKHNGFLDLEAELSTEGSDSGDELTDDSAGSIAEFICDDNLTQRDDMRAVYMKSVRSPVKGVFKIPVLPKKFNKDEVFSQFVEEDSYQMDSFCVDGHIGLTQVHDYSELELAEMLLEEKRRKKPKRDNDRRPKERESNNDDSPIVRKKRTVKRIQSESDDSS